MSRVGCQVALALCLKGECVRLCCNTRDCCDQGPHCHILSMHKPHMPLKNDFLLPSFPTLTSSDLHLLPSTLPRTHREGNKVPKKEPGFVVFVLKPLPHPHFQRRGADLVHKLTLPLYQALVGTAVNVQTLDHRWVGVLFVCCLFEQRRLQNHHMLAMLFYMHCIFSAFSRPHMPSLP